MLTDVEGYPRWDMPTGAVTTIQELRTPLYVGGRRRRLRPHHAFTSASSLRQKLPTPVAVKVTSRNLEYWRGGNWTPHRGMPARGCPFSTR